MANTAREKTAKTIRGRVVSDKMDQTIVVVIDRVKTHPIYKKKFTVSKKYKVHDSENKAKIGDIVEITSTKPISKDKHYKLV